MLSEQVEKKCEEKIAEVLGSLDPAHDLLHVKRVVKSARQMAQELGADLNVVIPAAWLHDLVNLSKDHPERKKASRMAADEAIIFLNEIGYEKKYFPAIHHAISAHSFSAEIKAETLEAQIVQDADRLDALGAVGIGRLFVVISKLGRSFYDQDDPFAKNRELDDRLFGIDHIFIKLKKISSTMNTTYAQQEASKRFLFIEKFLEELKKEI